MLKSIDRHILRRELASFLAIVALVTAMLAIENVPRIWSAVSQMSAPAWLFGRMVMALLPEYLAVGILIASFLAPAWLIRSMALRGEWQAIPAAGLSPWRAMLAPLILAAGATGGQLLLRLELEPRGERLFEQLGASLERGAFGLPIKLDEFVEIEPGTVILLTPSVRADRHFGKAFMRRDAETFVARSANVRRDTRGRIEIDMFDGQQIARNADGKERVMAFATFRFAFSPKARIFAAASGGDRLNQLPAGALVRSALRENAMQAEARPMTAALLARISSALFCLMLPWLAYVLALPPQRERGGAGIFLGIGALVLFLRTNSLVEAHSSHWPIAAAVIHLGLWAAGTAALVRFGLTHEDGVIDHALSRAWAAGVRRWRRRAARSGRALRFRGQFGIVGEQAGEMVVHGHRFGRRGGSLP